MIIASKLKTILAKRNITLKAFAKKVDIDYNHLSKFCNGKADLSLKSIEKILKELDLKKFDSILDLVDSEETINDSLEQKKTKLVA